MCERVSDFLENKNYKEAVIACDQAIKINPFLIYAWNFKGCALYNLQQYEEAIQNFDAALGIDEKFILSWQNKGDSLQKLDRDEEALIAYEKVIYLNNESYYAWINKSVCLCNLQRYSEAFKACEIATTIEPEDYEAWYIKASCAAGMKNSEEVLENLQKALNLNREECREKAKNDPCFDFIRNQEKYKALIEESSVGIDYSELKKLLANKQWKKADQETAKLMLSAVQVAISALSEDEQEDIEVDAEEPIKELNENILKKFPCDDLKTIDRLWLEYSGEKFGFSIQKEIYQNLGGTQEFNGEIRDKFGNQTGWRVRDKNGKYLWVHSDKFIYDFEKAPRGHLPSCLWAGKEDGWFSNRRDRLISLFGRMDTCSIAKSSKN